MPKTKLAITLERDLVEDLDDLIADHRFANRSQAIEAALAEKLARLSRTRLGREAARLDPREEARLADEGLEADVMEWPAY